MAIVFDEKFYLQSKFNQLEEKGQLDEFGLTDVASLKTFFEESGVDAQQHYLDFGMAEGLNPSADFDTNAYLNAKLAQLQNAEELGDDYADSTIADVAQAFQNAGLTALQHFNEFGVEEGLEATPADDSAAPSDLTEALSQLADAEAGVTAALTAAAETVNEAKGDNALEGDALDTYVEQFDEADLTQAVTDADAKVDAEQAKVDGAVAKRSAAQNETFSAATSAAQGAGTESAASTLVSANIVSDDDRLTDANIAQALADAQAEVNSDDADYMVVSAEITGSGTVSAVAAGEAAEIVGVGVVSSSVAEVTGDDIQGYAIKTVSAGGTPSFANMNGSTVVSGTSFANAIAEADLDLTTAKALQTELITAESALSSDKSANGSDAELLTDLRTAISNYADAGGDLSESINNSGSNSELSAANQSLNKLLAAINKVVGTEATNDEQLVIEDLFATASGGAEVAAELSVSPSVDAATEKAINDVLAQAFDRKEKYDDVDAADTAFGSTNTGEVLGAAETLEDAREELSDNVSKFEDNLSEAQDNLDTLEAAKGDYDSATSDVEDAQKYFEDNGLEVPKSLEGGVTATEDNDLFLFNGEESTLSGFGLEGEDQIFFGSDYTFLQVSEDGIKGDNGDANALEVFWEEEGNNLNLYVEDKATAGNGSTEADLVEVTLAGVSADDVDTAGGFMTAGTAADIA